MDMYVIEIRNGNPKILKENKDGVYEAIAFSAGEDNLENVKELVMLANARLGDA